MSITCGIDWAEAHHDVAVLDGAGSVLERRRIDTGVTGFGQLMHLLAEHTEDATQVPVAIETDKNLIVVALHAAGLTVYPINPRAVARYWERHGQSGKKPDPGDAFRPGRSVAPRPASASAAACDQRRGAGGEGPGPAAPGGDLGAALDRQPASVGAAGVISPSAASFSDAHAQGGI